jgi:serine/threonine protein kinase
MATYNRLKELGSGCFGTVYLVEHSQTKNQFALKIIENSDSSYAKQEVEILKMTKHTNIIKYHNSFRSAAADGKLCILLEYADQGTFESVYSKATFVIEEFCVWRVLSHISSALSYLHKLKVVHNSFIDNFRISIVQYFRGDFFIGSFYQFKRKINRK